MSPLVFKALDAITMRTNLTTGLSHPNDMNAAKEMFVRLHRAGESLQASEIESYAASHNWSPRDAKELGKLAAKIGEGKKVVVSDGPWWNDDILEQLRVKDGA